jgi:hypothetical protein
MYSIQQFESALQNVGVLPGYDIFLGKKNYDPHRLHSKPDQINKRQR